MNNDHWWDDDLYKIESESSPGGKDQYWVPMILKEYRRRMKNDMRELVLSMRLPSSMTPDRKAAYLQALQDVVRKLLKN